MSLRDASYLSIACHLVTGAMRHRDSLGIDRVGPGERSERVLRRKNPGRGAGHPACLVASSTVGILLVYVIAMDYDTVV